MIHRVRRAVYLLLGLCVIPGVVVADVERTEEFRYPLADGGRVAVSNVNGDIRVEGGASGEVLIRATRRAGNKEKLERIEIRIDASADTLRIETRHPSSRWGWNDGSGSVSYDLTVPASARLDGVSTVNGNIGVSGVDGEVRAETVNGDLELDGLASDTRLETVNGAIEARFRRLGGGQRVSADSVNGRIELFLPADASARITADTLNGRLDADDFGLEVEKGFVGRELDGEIGGGDARVKLDTVNGGIRIRRQ